MSDEGKVSGHQIPYSSIFAIKKSQCQDKIIGYLCLLEMYLELKRVSKMTQLAYLIPIFINRTEKNYSRN